MAECRPPPKKKKGKRLKTATQSPSSGTVLIIFSLKTDTSESFSARNQSDFEMTGNTTAVLHEAVKRKPGQENTVADAVPGNGSSLKSGGGHVGRQTGTPAR